MIFTDGLGNDYAVPLQLAEVERRPRKRTKKVIYGLWRLNDNPLVPEELRGTTVRIRHNSTTKERNKKPHTRRTTALRVYTRDDPVFKDNYTTRENAESAINHIKSHLPERRLNIVGRHKVLSKLYAVQHSSITTALINHADRTGAELTKWFGNHIQPASQRTTQYSRAGPLPLAA